MAEIDHAEKVEESIALNLKVLEYCKKTDLQWVEAKVYGDLISLYVMKGDLKKAKEYDAAISKMPPEYPVHLYAEGSILMGRNLLAWAEKQWKITLDIPEIEKNMSKDVLNMPGWLYSLKRTYAWLFEKQGKFEEAKIQAGEATKILEEAEQNFLHASVDANLMMQRRIQVGQEFEMRLDLVNVARTPASLTRIEGLVPQEYDVVSLPSFCSLRNDMINLNGKTVNPFTVETIKLKLKATKAGKFTLNPSITYADDQGKTKTAQPAQITLTAQTPKPAFEVQPGRIATGYADLDNLLFGGIPEHYAVALTSPSTDEREQLIRRFLEAGATAGEIVLHITAEAASAKALSRKIPFNLLPFRMQPPSRHYDQERTERVQTQRH